MSYGFNEFLRDLVSNNTEPDDEIYNYLSATDVGRVNSLLIRLNRVRSSDPTSLNKSRPVTHKYSAKKSIQGQQTRLLGKLLELIMLKLLSGCHGITVGANLRSTTSEIDFMIGIGPTALAIPIFKSALTHLIGEAKCYSSGFKSTWVNELVGLMQAHSTTHSILFTACPSKVLRTDHRHLIQLHGMKGDRVIPFGLAQVHEIASGKNFLKVLSDQYVRVLNATSDLSI